MHGEEESRVGRKPADVLEGGKGRDRMGERKGMRRNARLGRRSHAWGGTPPTCSREGQGRATRGEEPRRRARGSQGEG